MHAKGERSMRNPRYRILPVAFTPVCRATCGIILVITPGANAHRALPHPAALCTLLGIAMASRFNNSKKFMPAGLVAMLSLGLAVGFVGVGL